MPIITITEHAHTAICAAAEGGALALCKTRGRRRRDGTWAIFVTAETLRDICDVSIEGETISDTIHRAIDALQGRAPH